MHNLQSHWWVCFSGIRVSSQIPSDIRRSDFSCRYQKKNSQMCFWDDSETRRYDSLAETIGSRFRSTPPPLQHTYIYLIVVFQKSILLHTFSIISWYTILVSYCALFCCRIDSSCPGCYSAEFLGLLIKWISPITSLSHVLMRLMRKWEILIKTSEVLMISFETI